VKASQKKASRNSFRMLKSARAPVTARAPLLIVAAAPRRF